MIGLEAMANFTVIAKEGEARVGVLQTAHGRVETPVFMPVGTQGSVKALDPEDLRTAGAQIILGNTYHLNLRPTSELIKQLGGLHQFMGWDGPILTDSGGFQAFSLGDMIAHGIRKVPNSSNKSSLDNPTLKPTLAKISEEGVQFTSHIDGSKHLLTPERSIEIQLNLGSDIVLVLDELLSPMHNRDYARQSLERTHRWELRSLKYFQEHVADSINPNAQIFGIVQGVYDKKIRQAEAKWVAEQDFDGISIGGSMGTSEFYNGDDDVTAETISIDWAASKAIAKTVEWVVPFLPASWPRHVLGIGEIQNLFDCVQRGADMFDCVAATRRARNGSLYISPKQGGKVQNKYTLLISKAEYKMDAKPIDQLCSCYTCQHFTRAYLRHLYLAKELLYYRLASIHNVYFLSNLMSQMREAIKNQELQKLKKEWTD